MTWTYLMRVLDAWWVGYVTDREWRRALRLVAFGTHGTDVLRMWWERGA